MLRFSPGVALECTSTTIRQTNETSNHGRLDSVAPGALRSARSGAGRAGCTIHTLSGRRELYLRACVEPSCGRCFGALSSKPADGHASARYGHELVPFGDGWDSCRTFAANGRALASDRKGFPLSDAAGW